MNCWGSCTLSADTLYTLSIQPLDCIPACPVLLVTSVRLNLCDFFAQGHTARANETEPWVQKSVPPKKKKKKEKKSAHWLTDRILWLWIRESKPQGKREW
jgi:hypothetical protein